MFRHFSFLLSLLLIFLILLTHCPLSASSSFAPNNHSQMQGVPPEQSSSTALNLSGQEQAFLQTHPVIRVGNEDDWPPFDFSIHGQPTGYAIDHLELLGRRLGISFEYVNGYSLSIMSLSLYTFMLI
jgi:ABC-type amino acid transport substrate-binding protein